MSKNDDPPYLTRSEFMEYALKWEHRLSRIEILVSAEMILFILSLALSFAKVLGVV